MIIRFVDKITFFETVNFRKHLILIIIVEYSLYLKCYILLFKFTYHLFSTFLLILIIFTSPNYYFFILREGDRESDRIIIMDTRYIISTSQSLSLK